MSTAATGRPLHPALHFEPGLVSVGILDAAGKPVLVTRLGGGTPTRVWPTLTDDDTWHAGTRLLHPAPMAYARFNGRWDAADLAAFCADGQAPGFAAWLTQLRAALCGLIEFPRPEIASLIACWIAGTYFFPLFNTFPRLNLNGRKHSGKSKTLQVIAATAFNGLWYVIPTAATLFRLIEPLRPTLCLDEMEKLDRGETGAIEGVLNAGYKAGSRVPRTEEIKGVRTVVDYDVYAPVALAGIKGLNHVLADRAITVMMQKGHHKTHVNAEVDMNSSAFAELRAMGYRLALTACPQLVKALDALTAKQDTFKHLAGRPLELYRPLIAVALLAVHEGEGSFMTDLDTLVKENADDEATVDPDTARLFTALEKCLGTSAAITVYPGKLIPDEWGPGGWLDGGQVGKLLKQHGFPPGKRTKDGQSYTITWERFLGQAHVYGCQVGAEGPGGTSSSVAAAPLVEDEPELPEPDWEEEPVSPDA